MPTSITNFQVAVKPHQAGSRWASFDDDFSGHSVFAMVWNEARILEGAGLGELPEYFARLLPREPEPVWFIMRHAWMFAHRRSVLQVILCRSQEEFMVFGPDVADDKFDLLAALHFDTAPCSLKTC
jgi:hypothetical protein